MRLIDRLFRRGRDEPAHRPAPGHGGHDQDREHATREPERHGGQAEHAADGHRGHGGHRGGRHH
jgi:hypothetical protein